MYNTSASDLERVVSDLGQIARTYTNAAHELDQQVITLEGAVAHVLNDGVMQWKGLSSEAFVSAWLERRARLQQASMLMSTAAGNMTTLAQTIESNLPIIRAEQSIQLQPIFASMPSNDQQAILDQVSQAQNAIFMAVAALNSQLEAMAAEVSDCPQVDRDAGTPGYYDNVSRSDAGGDTAAGDGSGGGSSDGSESGVGEPPYTDPSNIENPIARSYAERMYNAIEDHLTSDDLQGAWRDLHGDPVPNPNTGGYYDHLGEVNNAMRSIRNAIETFKELLDNPGLSNGDRAIVQDLLSKGSKTLDYVENVISRDQWFPGTHIPFP
jgi:tetratricopeptide (TPR) repeat protein